MKCDESGMGRDESAAVGTNRADSGTNQRRSCCHAARKGGPLDVVQDYRRLLDRKDIAVTFVLEKGPMGGGVFIGDRGKLEINRNKVVSNPPEIAAGILAQVDVAAEERAWSDETALWQARQHLQNWLDCIRSRERPVADVEIGHRSITVCHLAGIARRLGRPLEWNPDTERFVSDPEADALLSRPRRAGFELPVV